ncbi:MAG: Fe-S cluster assembly ATPase SufC [Clostridia bacterium]|jgi:Fe-S cluster assembly ATP-binding protein|nr:Fe-S cluster assembly ATPase SufC [Clostridia bacterium]
MSTNLEIKNLQAKVNDKQILFGANLNISGGEIHVIMGPNGTGKSTFASVIMGDSHFTVIGGDIVLNGESILNNTVDERARKGIFLAMQYPMTVSGVTNSNFIKAAVQAVQGQTVSVTKFMKELDIAVNKLEMDRDLPYRYLNDGFSGGEKKRNEILQMLMLKPKIIILDEIDSGLDVDALKVVGKAIKEAVNLNTAVLIITHYQKILDYVKPTHVHIMIDGNIVLNGGVDLLTRIDKEGFDFIKIKQNKSHATKKIK